MILTMADSRCQQSSSARSDDNKDAPPSPPMSADHHQQKLQMKPQATFLTKLYALLERPENHHMIRWDPSGEHIIVQMPEQLALHVLPGIYRQSRFSSFARQLNVYGFMRSVDPAFDDPDASIWAHPTLNRHSPLEVVANFKRRSLRLPKPRKRDVQDHVYMPRPTVIGIGSTSLTVPSSVSNHNKSLSFLSTMGPPSQGNANGWGNNSALLPQMVPSDPPYLSQSNPLSENSLDSSEPDKYYEQFLERWVQRPPSLAEDHQQTSSHEPTHQPTSDPKTDGPECFTSKREPQRTFSARIAQVPEHDRPQSSGLNVLSPSHNSSRESRSPSLRSIPRSFSGRHEQSYDSQMALTQQFVEGFMKALRERDLSEEDHQKYLELKDGAVQAAGTYRRAISDYKDTGSLNIITKVRKMGQVRKHKRRLRDANADLQDHYYSSATDGSDASSIAAQSGSPPSSGLVAENIREWRDSVPDQASEQQSNTAPEFVKDDEEFRTFVHDYDSDKDFRKKSIVVYNDNRIITKNINSGNTNHKRTYDSYNSVSHSGVNLESYESVSQMDTSRS